MTGTVKWFEIPQCMYLNFEQIHLNLGIKICSNNAIWPIGCYTIKRDTMIIYYNFLEQWI